MIERGPYGAQYMIAELPECVETDYQMDIMMKARPEFLLPVYRQITAHGCRFAYPVTGLDSLADLAAASRLNRKQALTRKQALRLVRQLQKDLERLPDHLLTPEQVLVRPEALFLEPAGNRLLLVYRPFLPVDGAGTVPELMHWLSERVCRSRWRQRRLMIAAGFADSGESKMVILLAIATVAVLAAVAASVTLWRSGYLRSARNLRLILLGLLIMVIPALVLALKSQKPALSQPKTTSPEKQPRQNKLPWINRLNPLPLARRTMSGIRKRAAESPASQERMHDLPTQLLSSRQELFRLATISEGMIGSTAEAAGQRAFILNDEFVVGRDGRTADLCLTGNAVGRQHARITRQGAAFFITDLGSRNGTRLNGERLNKLESYLLPDRCQLQFADRLFYFEAEQLPVGA